MILWGGSSYNQVNKHSDHIKDGEYLDDGYQLLRYYSAQVIKYKYRLQHRSWVFVMLFTTISK
jgi:hypothetical protein